MNNENKKIKNLPPKPGVYLFTNNTGQVIYIGKAKNLKKRVSSYFIKKTNHPQNKLSMISKIDNLEYIITDTENEALLLETNLIKKHQPKYNIILKDDKNHLYIKLNLKEEWPKVELVRRPQTVVNNKVNKRVNKIVNGVNKFFGPYASSDSARQTLKLISRIFKFCTCKNFTKRPCLKYHLGWCVCPAETKISNFDYKKIFTHVAKFLKGQTNEILRELKIEMKKASNQKKYEKAAHLRDQIQAIKKVTAKQKVITLKNENYDVVSLARTPSPVIGGAQGGVKPPSIGGDARGGKLAAINLFIVRHGKLINKLNFILEHTQNSTNTEIIESFISQHYSNMVDMPKEIIVPQKLSTINYKLSTISYPTRGKKRQLITLGTQNAKEYLNQHLSIQAIQASSSKKILSELKKLLHLKTIPHRIEAYDISNISGQNPAGSMIVFTNGQPDKSEYRKFAIKKFDKIVPPCQRPASPSQGGGGIKGGEGVKPNDVAMMAEVIKRRLKNKDWPKPDLILLDGGKPQLNTVLKLPILSTINNQQLAIISLAKREEEIYLPNRSQPVILPKTSPILQLLQRARDEAHRFAKNYYINQHKKESAHSKLDDIPGIGPANKKKLLQKFGSVAEIKKQPQNEIAKTVNKKIAQKISERL